MKKYKFKITKSTEYGFMVSFFRDNKLISPTGTYSNAEIITKHLLDLFTKELANEFVVEITGNLEIINNKE